MLPNTTIPEAPHAESDAVTALLLRIASGPDGLIEGVLARRQPGPRLTTPRGRRVEPSITRLTYAVRNLDATARKAVRDRPLMATLLTMKRREAIEQLHALGWRADRTDRSEQRAGVF